jgi:hypothetical protein
MTNMMLMKNEHQIVEMDIQRNVAGMTTGDIRSPS